MEETGYMSTVRLEAVNTPSVAEIDMQPASYDIWDKKYRLKSKQGEVSRSHD